MQMGLRLCVSPSCLSVVTAKTQGFMSSASHSQSVWDGAVIPFYK